MPPFDPASLLLESYPVEVFKGMQRRVSSAMFISASFTMEKV